MTTKEWKNILIPKMQAMDIKSMSDKEFIRVFGDTVCTRALIKNAKRLRNANQLNMNEVDSF